MLVPSRNNSFEYVGNVLDNPSLFGDVTESQSGHFLPPIASSVDVRSNYISPMAQIVAKPSSSFSYSRPTVPGTKRCMYKSYDQHVYKHTIPGTSSASSGHVLLSEHTKQESDCFHHLVP